MPVHIMGISKPWVWLHRNDGNYAMVTVELVPYVRVHAHSGSKPWVWRLCCVRGVL